MAFKKSSAKAACPETPVDLFQDLPRRKHPSLYDHQGQVLRDYHSNALNQSDVALQLPTGSGKTLVGMLIAEWRRRKYSESVLYLCPTRQLVNQVVKQANEEYGVHAEAFLGSKREYSPQAKAAYQDAGKVCVATYSSLFNVNPFFNRSGVIIFDDAHVAENYIANQWSMSIQKSGAGASLFSAVSGVLKKVLGSADYERLSGSGQSSEDMHWVDKVPSSDVASISEELKSVIDVNVGESEGVKFKWGLLRDHIRACQIYLSVKEILIRPIIPPTWTHHPFHDAKQRIYMSATLGQGGDLERMTGRSSIKRLSVPVGWGKRGNGRRYFIFPEKSLDKDQVIDLRNELMDMAGRSLVLTANDVSANQIISEVRDMEGFSCFGKDELEDGKEDFVSSDRAVAVLANRYDGIDFPGEECRLLFVDNLSKATNLQERFFMERMGAGLLYNERIASRMFQAVGRCTRGLNDYAAVVVTGDDALDCLARKEKWRYFHPEFQAELGFGVDQSTGVSKEDILDNFRIFLKHDNDWERANQDIIDIRDSCEQVEFPAMGELGSVVSSEIAWQKAMWDGDYQKAFEKARSVLTDMSDPVLRGYRAIWHYLAGSAAELTFSVCEYSSFESFYKEQYKLAKDSAPGVPWLIRLANRKGRGKNDKEVVNDACVALQVERLEREFVEFGSVSDRKFNVRDAEIRKLLREGKTFERGQELLGKHLGFEVGKEEADASPDPWWMLDGFVIVFEDHANAKEGVVIDPTKARQVSSHPKWIKEKLPSAKEAEVLPVLVTPAKTATGTALTNLDGVSYWRLDEFREWADSSLSVIRELRSSFGGVGDLDWRRSCIESLRKNCLDMPSLFKQLKSQSARKMLSMPSEE